MCMPVELDRLRLRFPIYGKYVPVDHGEPLYASLCTEQPKLHGLDGFIVSPIIQAEPLGKELMLTHESHVYVQIPQTQLPLAVALAGKTYRIRQSSVRLGPPSISLIQPAAKLYSRFVTSKHAETEDDMGKKLNDYLIDMESHAKVQVQRRRIMMIHGKKVVGFGVLLANLEEEPSVRIQVDGIFGRRRYSAGVFLPASGMER